MQVLNGEDADKIDLIDPWSMRPILRSSQFVASASASEFLASANKAG